jgi:hypothetical protein
LHRKIAQFKKI